MNSDEIFDMERELSKGFAGALEKEREFVEEESLYFQAVCALQRLRLFIQEKEERSVKTNDN